MKAMVYTETGSSEVLKLVERDKPEPGPGEVLVKVAVSGVNPTDWKARRGSVRPMAFPEIVPNQDGAGTIEAIGAGVDPARVGERVWLWEVAWQRPNGTAQEYVALPSRQAVPLPREVEFDVGASLGIPALTAHRCLTLVTPALGPGTLSGRTVLVAGGAGAVGNAAIQLASWSGAQVISTVSGPEKAALARAAGANVVVNYRTGDPAREIRDAAPDGADIIVEVAPNANAALNHAVIAPAGTIAVYGAEENELTVPVLPLLSGNVVYQFVLVYTVPDRAKHQGVLDVAAAVDAGALRVGADAGLPLHHFPFERTAEAHDAVQQGAVGKVLISVA
jgi:NADPH:quinone reductase